MGTLFRLQPMFFNKKKCVVFFIALQQKLYIRCVFLAQNNEFTWKMSKTPLAIPATPTNAVDRLVICKFVCISIISFWAFFITFSSTFYLCIWLKPVSGVFYITWEGTLFPFPVLSCIFDICDYILSSVFVPIRLGCIAIRLGWNTNGSFSNGFRFELVRLESKFWMAQIQYNWNVYLCINSLSLCFRVEMVRILSEISIENPVYKLTVYLQDIMSVFQVY